MVSKYKQRFQRQWNSDLPLQLNHVHFCGLRGKAENEIKARGEMVVVFDGGEMTRMRRRGRRGRGVRERLFTA